MKFLSTLRNRLRKNLVKNQSGQGATEYILLLVVVVGMVVAFGPKIKKAITEKTTALENDMGKVNSDM
jgi:Flp pilus assembly pilin Flp